MTKEELKEIAIKAIDNRKEDIFAIGDSIYDEPELGYKEFKTAEKVKEVFDSLEMQYKDKLGITGLKADIKGRKSNYKIGVIGELDSIITPSHPDSDPETGAVHACGHNCMIAGIIGVTYALKDTDIMKHLDGDVSIIAVPAEEYSEIEYRRELIEKGEISFIGGKQEFIKLGVFDDIDIALMQHTFPSEDSSSDIKAMIDNPLNGFIGQQIQYIGKESHAGHDPHRGVNALEAANIGLIAVNAQRTTFREEDYIRVHPVITKGGDSVNTIPADVRLENYIRGSNVDAILDATEKVNRSWHAGAYAMGAEVKIDSLPGYMPLKPERNLRKIMYDNLCMLFGENHVLNEEKQSTGSSDLGDVASILPVVQALIGGATGGFHSESYRLEDRDLAYLGAAKVLALTLIDLLYDDAQESKKIVENFEPTYTTEEYLEEWGGITEKFK